MDLSKFEALKLDVPDFIVDPDAQNICFFPLPLFTRISEMLSPSDFVHLAQTCRYMHWRMFKYGHLMLKHHNIINTASKENSRITEVVTIEGKPIKYGQIIVHRPYVYFEYLHLQFCIYNYSSSVFDKMIDYVSAAKKRTKRFCIKIEDRGEEAHECTQQTFQDVNNLIEKINPFNLELYLSWSDHKLTVEIPNIKNIYSVYLYNEGYPRETEFYMNPCAIYYIHTVEDLHDIVQEFIKNSCLQSHICDIVVHHRECRAMLEKKWNLKFKEADETLKNRFRHSKSNLYASIPSEHGDVEIIITDLFIVIQRKETYIGQWEDFYRNVRRYD